jgi:Zn-dependent peptidase ImmA (M78 family)/transcriptional regulator with XRE-family HTH domain
MSPNPTLPDRLREAREAAGLTQQQAADWLGLRRPGIVEIESGKRAVKSEELARLATLYGRSLRWLVQGEESVEETLSAALFRAGHPPDGQMKREVAKLARRCHTVCRLEDALQLSHQEAVIPQYADERALSDQGLAIHHGKAVAHQERNRLGLGLTAPLSDPWGIVEGAGLHVFPLELGPDHVLDGVFTRGGGGRACVGVNVDKWVFRQVFTVVHEYGHALMDSDIQGEVCATGKGWGTGSEQLYANRELRANQFAAVFLVPREALLSYLEARHKLRFARRHAEQATALTAIDLVRAQDHFGASGEMLLWRLRNEGLIDAAERQRLKDDLNRQGTTALASALGYNWKRRAQPFIRAYEIALSGYAAGHLSLGGLAEVFGKDKEDMYHLVHEWGVAQAFDDDDALVGRQA